MMGLPERPPRRSGDMDSDHSSNTLSVIFLPAVLYL